MKPLRLIADIGGTYARLALQRHRGRYTEVRVFPTSEFADLPTLLRAYLAGRPVREAVLAVGTPVEGDLIRFVKLPWSFSQAALRAEFNFERLAVINDFVAQALAVPRLTAPDLERIGGGAVVPGRPAVVLGPGTGLGCAVLTWHGNRAVPMASEAGHCSLAPEDARETALLDELRRQYGHVSYERIVSGPGLLATARILAQSSGQELTLRHPGEVVARAHEQDCPHCREALQMFAAVLGSFAGNVALTVLARGGVYLVGSLLSRLGSAFATDLFRTRFEAKGRLRDILLEIPTFWVRREDTGLLGASWYAFDPDSA